MLQADEDKEQRRQALHEAKKIRQQKIAEEVRKDQLYEFVRQQPTTAKSKQLF